MPGTFWLNQSTPARVPYRNNGGRTRHEYRLTPAGGDTTPILRALADWGAQHTQPAQPAQPMQFLHQTCGYHLTNPETYCQHCQQSVQRDDQVWLSPWRLSTPYPLAQPVTPGNRT